MKKAVIYYRVSTEDQAQFGVSLEQQKKSCLSYAESNGFKVVKMFHDDGVSAKTADRQSLQAMLKFCAVKSNGVDCLIVYKIDRLTRNVNDYTNILLMLKKLSIQFVSTSEAGIDETPIGKFIGNLMASSAQLDNEIKSQRVSACMREKVEQGYWCWKAKIGYLNSRDALGKTAIILDPERAPLISWIFKEYSTGLFSVEEIKLKVNEMGLKTWRGGEISSQLMHKILTNKFFIGIMTVSGAEYPGKHDKITDENTFYKCQKILNGGSRADSCSRNQASEIFPLRHFAICSYCGRPLTAYMATGKCGGRYPYYRCYNKNCEAKRSTSKSIVEGHFMDYLHEITPKNEFLKNFKAVILDVWKDEYANINSNRENRLTKLIELGKDKEKLIDMKRKELLPDEDFKEEFAKVKQAIESEKAELASVSLDEFNVDEAVDYVFDYIKDLPENWQTVEFDQKLKLQSLIFNEKPIYDYQTFYTPKLSPILQTKRDLAQAKSPLVPPRRIELRF